jgi:hypothetical protein
MRTRWPQLVVVIRLRTGELNRCTRRPSGAQRLSALRVTLSILALCDGKRMSVINLTPDVSSHTWQSKGELPAVWSPNEALVDHGLAYNAEFAHRFSEPL